MNAEPAETFPPDKMPIVLLPFTVGGTEKAKDLFGLYDDTVARLLVLAR